MALMDLLSLSPQQAQGGALLLAISICCWAYLRTHRSNLPYPPGPPPKSLLAGNLTDLPPKRAWETYNKWSETYNSKHNPKSQLDYAHSSHPLGDIIHFRVFGQHMVVLKTLDLARELLEKRSTVYSDRPYNAMIDLMEWDIAVGFKPYGPEWRHHRRLFQQAFRTGEPTLRYRAIQTDKVNDFLHSLLEDPDEFRHHCKALSAAVIMRVIYGYDSAPKEDYFVDLSEAAMVKMCDSWVAPGAMVVNTLPILRHLPSWFPGATFKKYAIEGQELTRKIRDVPFAFVTKSIAAGTAKHSVVSDMIANNEDQETIKAVAATGYGDTTQAGADTTMATLAWFFYAMILHPEVQKKAQEELDKVVGNGRLPTYEDRDSLPYIDAVVKEVLRWRPIVPLGLLHATSFDDIYDGYFIPKGTIVMANIWAIANDKNIYEKPEIFNPDRYFDNDGKLTTEGIHSEVWSFGFGRRCVEFGIGIILFLLFLLHDVQHLPRSPVGTRHGKTSSICPSVNVTGCLIFLFSNQVWLSIATVLSTFDILKKKDANGNVIPIDEDIEVADGLVSHAADFACAVTPRSNAARRVITEAGGSS
ncbi:hypothetical protein CVT25_000402 [Psilocybe cyanescens]|uniref:Cytochrome P450 n=1 Tax=Psilocybe cyanescens TaxID=93625 RepID=A0A409XUH5_PSICY|nr:hypothetical protein CVT25_000402 [Psilocybe cyanescens]